MRRLQMMGGSQGKGKGKDKGKDGGKGNDGNKKKLLCLRWLAGECKFGDQCRYEHEAGKKGSDPKALERIPPKGKGEAGKQRTVAEDGAAAAEAGGGDPNLLVETPERGRRLWGEESSDSHGDEEGKVRMSPLRIGVRASKVEQGDVPLVNFDKITLEIISKPQKGYHFDSDLRPAGLPDLSLHLAWDGGAEGSTISDRAASRVLRAQALLPETERRAFVDLARYETPQQFYGFMESEDKANSVKVDVQGWLRLATAPPESEELPELLVRVVRGQSDDVLVSAPDLDKLGWDRHNDFFLVSPVGVAIPRGENEALRCSRVTETRTGGMTIYRLKEDLELPPGATYVTGAQREGPDTGEEKWFVPCDEVLSLGVDVCQGPVIETGRRACLA